MARGPLIDSPANRQAGEALVRLRTALGVKTGRNRIRRLSQGQLGQLLAEDLGGPLSQTTISNWEGGEGVVPYTVLLAASRLLSKHLGRNVTVEEFVQGADPIISRP